MADRSNMDRELARLIQAAEHAESGRLPSTAKQDKNAQTKAAILEAMAKLGGNLVQEDALHFRGTEFILPEQYNGNTAGAIKFLQDQMEQQEKVHQIQRIFKYRPNDVANAIQSVMKTMYGTTGLGKDTMTMFGPVPPTFRTINVGLDRTAQVPAGLIEFPPIDGTFNVTATRDRELGMLGALVVECPRKYRGHVEGFFTAVEAYLAEHSIYRGQAIDGAEDPSFLDTSKVDPTAVVYSDAVLEELKVHLWAPIEHTDLLRSLGQPIKRAGLLYGNYGTGKSLAGYLTAQIAQRNGWTFLFVRPTDDLDAALKTAQLYSPAVVFFEDIDVVAEQGSPQKISQLLDSFDGVTSKGKEIIAILTTNHVDRIHKGMLRPGRMDAIIEIGELDASGVRKLIRSKIPADMLAADVDFAAVAESVKGYMPAFTSEVVNRAFRYAMVRNGGRPKAKLVTDDFVTAAKGLRPHFELMNDAHEGKQPPSLDAALRRVMKDVTEATKVYDSAGDRHYRVHTFEVGDEKATRGSE
jgi:hypothetical protein